MKRFILPVLLSLVATKGFSQNDSRFGSVYYIKSLFSLYGGGGLATSDNYNVALSGGAGYEKATGSGFYVGGHIFLQSYSLYYDNEANSATKGQGYAGVTLGHSSKYVFVAPQIRAMLGITPGVNYWMYFNGGIGFNAGGTETAHIWDHSYTVYPGNIGNFDTVLDVSSNINKTVYRIGLGFAQDLRVGRKTYVTFREDFGYLVSGLTISGDITDKTTLRTPYSPQKLNPVYISLQIGLTFASFMK